MKQITQKEVLETIEAKRKSAENAYMKAHMEGRFDDIRKNIDYMEAYLDAYCYIASVEIVPERIEENKGQFVGGNYPEEEIVTTIPKAKREELGITQDYLKKMIENTSKPQETPRFDRFREFCFHKGARRVIDAKAVKTISLEESYTGAGYDVYVDTIIMKKNELFDDCKNCYNDLVEWWKYWKQN